MNAVALMILARAPTPGACKTRLIPALGPEGAAALHARLVEHALRAAVASAVGPVTLWGAGDLAHPFFTHCARAYGVSLREQCAGDLGARMLHAFASTGAPALLAGSDAPCLSADDWRACAAALARCEAVFMPAEDGGYGLIGLRGAQTELFRDIAWSTDRVMAQTRTRLRALGVDWREERTIWDVDEESDLARLRLEFPQLADV